MNLSRFFLAAGIFFTSTCTLQLNAVGMLSRASDRSPEVQLTTAISGGASSEEIKILIDAGADINARDNFGHTPLHLASWNGDLEIVEALIAAGANAKAIDNSGRTPLHNPINHGSSEIVKVLIAAGANVNAINESGEIPLHNLSWRGDPETINVLIAAGANVNAVTHNGDTPLKLATIISWFFPSNNEEKCIQFLITAGARYTNEWYAEQLSVVQEAIQVGLQMRQKKHDEIVGLLNKSRSSRTYEEYHSSLIADFCVGEVGH